MSRRRSTRGNPLADEVKSEEPEDVDMKDVEAEQDAVEEPEQEQAAEDGQAAEAAPQETGDNEADDDEDEYVAEEDDDEPQRRRGRPPGSKNRATIARAALGISKQEDMEDAVEEYGSTAKSKKVRTKSSSSNMSSHNSVLYDELSGQHYDVINDEYTLPEDAAGEQKVNRLGELQGGREYRVRTFKVLGRGNRLYMLSTEPARCMGFRDSYLLFQKHKKLFKVVLDDDEKFDLIERDLIPHSYKGRTIGIVTARSVFREFGAKIIVGGKRVTDDYYEEEAMAEGYRPGQIADPDDKLPPPGEPYNKNQYVAWHGASSVYHQYSQPTRNELPPLMSMGIGLGSGLSLVSHKESAKRKHVVITDDNWMYEHAKAASEYNSSLVERRKATFKGVEEVHTGLTFYPSATQPTEVRWDHLSKGDSVSSPVVIETVLRNPPVGTTTSLADVPEELYAQMSDDVKAAIRQQIQIEKMASIATV